MASHLPRGGAGTAGRGPAPAVRDRQPGHHPRHARRILFDYIAVHLNGPAAAEADLRIDLDFTDHGERWTMWIKNGVLHARQGTSSAAQLTITGPKSELVGALLQPGAAVELAKNERITLAGDETTLTALAGLLDQFAPTFNIVTP